MTIIVIDVETNGLDADVHHVVEVAWHNMDTGEGVCFIPPHDVREILRNADIKALQLTEYVDRIADQPQDNNCVEIERLWNALRDNTLAGSNPRFDAAFLTKMFEQTAYVDVEPWHHRLWDLSAYAAGVLGLDYLPGAYTVCELLGLDIRPDHTAQGDVLAEVACFKALFEKAGVHGNS